jgi:hypothetical protein
MGAVAVLGMLLCDCAAECSVCHKLMQVSSWYVQDLGAAPKLAPGDVVQRGQGAVLGMLL